MAAVLLAVLLVWLLYVQYQTTSALVKVDHLAKEVDDLKVKLMVNEHLSTIKDSESNATIQFRDVRKFLDSDEKEKHGESFHFNDLSWHLSIKKISYSLKDQPDQFLAVYVCHDISDFFGYRFNDWYLHATFNLKMVSHDQKRKSFTEHFVGLFEKSESYDCLGKIFFVPIGDLYDGFVKDDAIDFELQFNNLKLLLKVFEWSNFTSLSRYIYIFYPNSACTSTRFHPIVRVVAISN